MLIENHNIAGRVKSASSSWKSTYDAIIKIIARWMKDDYPQLETEFIVLDGQMIGLFIQDPQMKSSFHHFPEVLMVDATQKTTENEMHLYALMSVDCNGESECSSLKMKMNLPSARR